MIMTCKQVLVPFSVQRIQFVRTPSLTLEAVGEMICNNRNINDLQINFLSIVMCINVLPSHCSFTRHTGGHKEWLTVHSLVTCQNHDIGLCLSCYCFLTWASSIQFSSACFSKTYFNILSYTPLCLWIILRGFQPNELINFALCAIYLLIPITG